jgi:thioredoxin 1
MSPAERVFRVAVTTYRGGTVGSTKKVTDQSFTEDVLASDKPVLVDFWAEWCGPCKMVAPVLEEIAAQHEDKITVAKLNIDENPQIAQQYQVLSIPTMSVFQGGKIVKTIVGAKPKSALLKDLADFI